MESQHRVVALYKFVKISEEIVPALKKEIESELRKFRARGTILLACEGINGTICYPEKLALKKGTNDCEKNNSNEEDVAILEGGKSTSSNHQTKYEGKNTDSVLEYFQKSEIFGGLRTRISYASTPIFHRLKVKVKKEIVTMIGDDEDLTKKSTSEVKNDLEENNENDIECSNPNKKLKKEKLKIDPTEVVGTYVKPGKEWDDLLMDPDVVVIDTRNKYEIEIGTFENAISPCTDNFRQFPDWLCRFSKACKDVDSSECTGSKEQCVVNDQTANTSFDSKPLITQTNNNPRSKEPVTVLPKIKRKPKAVAMFCTGGIRCEKSTSYALAAKVFDNDVPVYHLDGGILAYLDSHHDPNKSKWKGECFVFDQRVALTHGLKPSETYNSCHGCRRPVSDKDKKGEDYLQGVHCKHCKGDMTTEQRERFEERQKQMEMAAKKGTNHIHDPKEILGENES